MRVAVSHVLIVMTYCTRLEIENGIDPLSREASGALRALGAVVSAAAVEHQRRGHA